jgi:hypothetical protein
MRFFSALIILFCSFNGLAQNMLVNSDFEKKNLGWISWGSTACSTSHQGQYSMRITNKVAKWSGMHQIIALPDTVTRVEISGWMKTENIIAGKESWEKARISLEFVDKSENVVGGYPSPAAIADGNTPWTHYRSIFDVHKGAKAVKVIISLGNCIGTAWFDDLTCEFISDKQEDIQENSDNQLSNAGFETPGGWNYFGSQIDRTAHSGRFGLKVINRKQEWNGADQEIVLPENASNVTVSGWIKADSVVQGKESWEKARISIEFLDASGNLVNGYPPVTGETVGTHEWKEFSRSYTIPATTIKVKVQCALGNATGIAYFDDIQLTIHNEKNEVLKKGTISGIMDEGDWYPLSESEASSGGHYVDWSSLLDPPAGKHGFAKAKNGHIVFEDGTPARFWGTNLVEKDCFADDASIDSLVNRLARMGCNLLRLHHMDAPWAEKNIFGKSNGTRKLSEASLRQLDYLIYKCKQKGIYIFLDMLVHREFTAADGVEHIPADLGGKQVGFFSRKIIDLQKEYATQLLTHVNQFTKKAYKDEPAIVASEFINESTIYTHFSGDILTTPYRTELEALWNKSPYKEKKLATFGLAWDDEKGSLKMASQSGDIKESLEFMCSLELNYFKEMNDHFRKMGVKYLLCGSNFPQPLLVSLRSNSDLDLIINNQYWDHPQVWKISNDWNRILFAPFNNRSQLKSNLNRNVIQSKAYYKVDGKPYIITEWNHCYPNEQVLEGVPLMAAYAALQGWDGVLQFDFNHQNPSTHRIKNYTLSVAPEHLANWVMAAPLFLRGDVKTAPGLFLESISDSQTYSVPSYSSVLDKNYFLPFVTRTAKSFSGKSSGNIEEFRKYFDEKNNIIRSETGELTIDGNTGILQINSPRVQGVTGFIGDRKFDFPSFACSLSNTHASIYLVSADGKELGKSKRMFLVTTGPVKMSSQKYNSSRTALIDEGKLPALAQVLKGNITFKNKTASGFKVVPLSLSGSKGTAMELFNSGAGKVMDLSKGRTLVYEVSLGAN